MVSNSNIKMGRARAFWMDVLVDVFLRCSENFRAFWMKFTSPETGPEKPALEHNFGVQKTVPRNGPLVIITIAKDATKDRFSVPFLGFVFRIFRSRFWGLRIRTILAAGATLWPRALRAPAAGRPLGLLVATSC